MSHFIKQINPQLFELVNNITGITITDRFNPYKKLFEDKILHQSYVNVEKIKVENQINALKEKFIIHSQTTKADLLKFILKRFISRPLNGHASESEHHYTCIQLILSLSERPLEVNVENFTHLINEQKVETNFNWTAFLLGSQRQYEQHYGILDSEEFLSDQEEDETDKIINSLNDKSKQLETADDEKSSNNEGLIVDIENHSRTTLDKELIDCYWENDRSQMAYPLRDFALFWDETMIKTNHLGYYVNTKTLNEYIIIRETIWLLSGVENLYIYKVEDRKTHVADLVRLCDTTPVSIQECMKKFCLISNQLRFAWQFLNKTEYSCQTIKSFAYALQKQLQLIRFQLANIERETFEQSRIYTTLSFYQELETLAITSKAHLIDRIFNESSLLNNKSLSHRDQALELIHVLYQNLLIVEALDINVSIDFMLPIFTASCSVYLLIIEQWLKNGELHDPYDEFIVLRAKDVPVNATTFWKQSYVEQVENASLIPVWLTNISLLIKAGKCAELLKYNGELQKKNHFDNDTNFADQLLLDIKEKLKYKNIYLNTFDLLRTKMSQMSENSIENIENQNEDSSTKTVARLDFDDIDNEDNYFLKLAFERLQKPKASLLDMKRNHYISSSDSSITIPTIQSVMSQLIKNTIKYKCTQIINQLTNYLLNNLKYIKHMISLRDFYLFENGSFMHQFSIRLYERLCLKIDEPLDELTVLVSFDGTLNMFGIEKTRYPISVSYQSIQDKTVLSRSKYLIQNVQLRYILPDGLHIIINQKQMEIYQKCFEFVLQVKQAKYVVDQLIFVEFRESYRLRNRRLYNKSYHLQHEMFLLRANLLHAINAINNCVLTTFHTAGEIFMKKNSSQSIDIETMILYHDEFLYSIATGGLLKEKQQPIREQLLKLFEIITVFARLWHLGFDRIRQEQLDHLKTEFQTTKQFLVIVLKSLLTRAIDSPLKALAFALS